MKRLLIISILLSVCTAWAATSPYYQYPDAVRLNDTDRMLVYQNVTGSRNITGAKLKSTLSSGLRVSAYGAVGDGITNDRLAIQAALDAASAAGGGVVWLDAKTYLVTRIGASGSGCLYLPTGVTLRGIGPASVLKNTTANGLSVVINKGFDTPAMNYDVAVRDLTISMSGGATNGIVYGGVERGLIDNCTITDPAGYGIWLFRSGDGAGTESTRVPKYITVSNCRVSGVVDVGIEFYGCVGCSAVNNFVSNSASAAATILGGIYVWQGAVDCNIIGNVVEHLNPTSRIFAAIRVGGRDDITRPTATARILIANNVIRDAYYGVRIEPVSDTVKDISVTGNTISRTSQNGVGIYACNTVGVNISSNNIVGSTANFPIKINGADSTFATVSQLVISNNTINSGHQVAIYGGKGMVFSGNQLNLMLNHTVSIYGTISSTFVGNSISDSGSADIAGFLVNKYSTTESTGNIFSGNKIYDSRGTKYLKWVVELLDVSDYNLIVDNSAYGAKAGALAYVNAGTGANNIFEHNMNN